MADLRKSAALPQHALHHIRPPSCCTILRQIASPKHTSLLARIRSINLLKRSKTISSLSDGIPRPLVFHSIKMYHRSELAMRRARRQLRNNKTETTPTCVACFFCQSGFGSTPHSAKPSAGGRKFYSLLRNLSRLDISDRDILHCAPTGFTDRLLQPADPFLHLVSRLQPSAQPHCKLFDGSAVTRLHALEIQESLTNRTKRSVL